MLCEVYLFVKPGRPLARWLSKHTKMTPASATMMNLLFALMSIPFFLAHSHAAIIVGGLLVYLSGLWDTIDGNLARFRGEASGKGAWLDGIIDRIAEVLILGSIGFGIYLASSELWVLPVTIAAIFMQFFFYYGGVSYDLFSSGRTSPPGKEPLFTYCRALFVAIILFASLFNILVWTLIGFATIGNLYAVLVGVKHWRGF